MIHLCPIRNIVQSFKLTHRFYDLFLHPFYLLGTHFIFFSTHLLILSF